MTCQGEVGPETFQCSQCGVCCETQKVVLLTLADIFRMAGRLGMRPAAFYKRYCLKSDRLNDQGLTRIYLKTEGGCPFLKGRQCSVHDFKPIICALSPFYYLEASLAALKVMGVVVPGCTIERLPYDATARGDAERLVDMEIEVSVTDEYMRQSGRFDENNARAYYDLIRQALADDTSRTLAYRKLLDESMRREDHYRNDPYYRGATMMYLNGFYREFREEAGRMARQHDGLLTFEPAAVGTAGGEVIVVLQGRDFGEARRRLGAKEGGVSVSTTVRSGFEYAMITISTDGSPAAFFYYYVDRSLKPSIRRLPGKVAITFADGKGGRFAFAGDDLSGWLQ